MGFDEKLALNAVHKKGNNINKCIVFIESKQSAMTTKEEKEKESVSEFVEDGYNERISTLLSMDWMKEEDIYGVVARFYPKENTNLLVLDHANYIEHLDEKKPYLDETEECAMEKCLFLRREYRDRESNEANGDLRARLYAHCHSDKAIVIQQMLDQLHIARHHLIHIGLRDNDQGDQGDHGNIRRMRDRLNAKRKQFDALRKRECWMKKKDFKKQNKFVTKVQNENQDKYPKYGFGVRYYYHSYYQHNQMKQELIPGASGWSDNGNMDINASYTYSDWYIHPIYGSMKEEVLNGKNQRITMKQCKETVIKASMKLDALKHRIRGSRREWEIVYAMKRGSAITVKHIMSILLYTNFTDLSCEFSRTFRKTNEKETDKAFKARHRPFAVWARHLRETIDCFGESFADSTASKPWFYHGISCKMLFQGFFQKFRGPTSFTLLESVAVMFASQGEGDGIVIKVRNNGTATTYFDCRALSDFGNEAEMLFVGGFQELEISGLTAISDGTKHDQWIKAIKLFDSGLVKGLTSNENVSASDKDAIDALISDFVAEHEDDHKREDIPDYIRSLFAHFMHKTQEIYIDVGVLTKEVLWMHEVRGQMYGFKRLQNVYLNEDGNIKWKDIIKLFPSLRAIHIKCIDKIPNDPNGYKWAPSICITDDMLAEILEALRLSQKRIKIFIFYPENVCSSFPEQSGRKQLGSLINDHLEAFKECKYRLVHNKNYKHPQCGKCEAFGIFPF